MVETNDQDTTGNLAPLLDELRHALRRYVVLPSTETVDAVVLWIAATHAQSAWEHAPRLVIRAPEKRCGKSRLLDIVEATCHEPLMSVQVSGASIYRAIGAAGERSLTLLVDEADTLFGAKTAADHEDLRGLLNAGHQRNRRVPRWNANANKLEKLETFAMAALAGIGAMPDTIEDRGVVIHMRRRAPSEQVAAFRQRRDGVPLNDLRKRLAACLAQHVTLLQEAEPDMPLEDRAADTWEPLIALADLAGGTWPQAARNAAKALNAEHQDAGPVTYRLRLLMDCRTVFANAPAMFTVDLIRALNADPEAPWATYGRDGLTPKRMGDLLHEYGIQSKNIRERDTQTGEDRQAKGFERSQFLDAWKRYCPPATDDPAVEASHPSQGHNRRSVQGRIEDLGRIEPSQHLEGTAGTDRDGYPSAMTDTTAWDGSIRPKDSSVPALTSEDTSGTAGTEPLPQILGDPCTECKYTRGRHRTNCQKGEAP